MSSPAGIPHRSPEPSGPCVRPPLDVAAARTRCWRMRKRILEISQKVSALHIAGAYSCLEIVDTIYHSLMRCDAAGNSPDTFILSKGHGSMAQYAVLEEMGVIAPAELNLYCQPGGKLATHPDYGLPGIEASTGSLGHGLGLAVGMSLADNIQKEDRCVYTVLSDGELEEGSVWEMMMVAPSLGVKNVVAVVDLNDFQSLGQTSKILPNFYPVAEKIRAFGWEAAEVDGHSAAAVHAAIAGRRGDRPLMVAAKTIKGKGVSYMENVPIWHYRSPNPQEYQQALAEIDRAYHG